ncbi:MAG: DUF2760 domain-containing protein [bacterium]
MDAPARVDSPGFGARLALAFVLPWKILFNGVLAGRIVRALGGEAEAPALSPPPAPAPEPPRPVAADETAALQLLALLQREGRLLDFLQEDVATFSDADVGAAARVVHEGCKRGLAEYLDIEAVRGEAEGEPVVLAPGFDAAANKVTGNVVGEPPYRGRLAHHGWRVTAVRLPRRVPGQDARVVAPAEIELS